MKTSLKLSALALLLAGCTMVQGIKKEDFERPFDQYGDFVRTMETDLASKTALYQGVSTKSSTPKAAPYPEMGSLLPKMKAAADVVRNHRPRLTQIRAEFDDLKQGRPDMTSDRPQWVPFKKLYDEMQVTMPKMREEMKIYKDLSDHFNTLITSNNIMQIKTAEIKGQLGSSLAQLDQGVTDIRNQTAEAKKRLDARTAVTLGLVQETKRNEIVAKIKSLTDQIEAASTTLKGKVKAFEDSIAGKTEIWQGPGFAKVAIIDDVNQDMHKINDLGSAISGEINKWNEMNK